MSGFTQFLGVIAGQVASRVIINKVANVGLSQTTEPGREPGYKLPVIVPEGAKFDTLPEEAAVPSGRYKIPTWLFFTGYGALLFYAAKATAPVDIPDLGDPGPEEGLLFPGLKRELTHLDVEDISTSDDPVEACLERVGWKLDRVDELRQSIFEKEQVDLFTTPEPLTRSEGELLEAIESCMQKLEIQYGSLEAAGVVCSDCGDDPDLGAVQREMFDPEQIEIDYDTGEAPRLYKYLDSLEPGESANILDACNSIHGSEKCESAMPSAHIESVIDLVKQEGYFYLDDLRKAYRDKAEIPAHRKTTGG